MVEKQRNRLVEASVVGAEGRGRGRGRRKEAAECEAKGREA